MNEVQQLLSNPVQVMVIILCVLVAGKYLYELRKWYKDRFKEKHEDIKNEDDFRNEVKRIGCVSADHTKALMQIGDALENINERLDNMQKQRDRYTINNGRATLLQLYERLKDKEYISMSEFETFTALANDYLEAGGNSVFRDKIIPEIKSKPVRDE